MTSRETFMPSRKTCMPSGEICMPSRETCMHLRETCMQLWETCILLGRRILLRETCMPCMLSRETCVPVASFFGKGDLYAIRGDMYAVKGDVCTSSKFLWHRHHLTVSLICLIFTTSWIPQIYDAYLISVSKCKGLKARVCFVLSKYCTA